MADRDLIREATVEELRELADYFTDRAAQQEKNAWMWEDSRNAELRNAAAATAKQARVHRIVSGALRLVAALKEKDSQAEWERRWQDPNAPGEP